MLTSLYYQAGTLFSAVSHHQSTWSVVEAITAKTLPEVWSRMSRMDFYSWLYIISNLLIWAVYFAVPVLLLRLVIKRKDGVLNHILLLFLAFTLLSGVTRLLDALFFWWPAYHLIALLRLATAVVSVMGAYMLNRAFPTLLGLRSVKQMKQEIAKRKATEDRLLESEFLLDEAGRIARVGGWEYDLRTKRYKWSKTVYKIFEVPGNHDISLHPPLSYYPAPYQQVLKRAAIDAVRYGKKWDIEAPIATVSHKSLWVRYIGEPVFNHKGEVIKIRGTLTDIDQYKRTELELSRALKATMEQSERLKQFSYIVSHNIRNHTSNLEALASLINAHTLDEENTEIQAKSIQVTQALSATLDDLAKIIAAQDEEVVKESVRFADAAAKAIAALSAQTEQPQAIITQNFEQPKVSFPPLYLNSILKHLLSNALTYRNPGSAVQIQLSTYVNGDDRTVLECRDNGLGMDLDLYKYKLFNLYATLHPSLSGRGVGLFLIKTQITSQGGKISVDSQPGEGTVFRVIFKKGD